MIVRDYDREHAVAYAEAYALSPNPMFADFSGYGGNCTNFASQCLFAGCCQMNFEPTYGWYYRTLNDRAPAWTGVRYFYNFMTGNAGIGPFGFECGREEVEPGDFVQIAREDRGGFYHTLIVVGCLGSDLLVAAQSDNYFGRRLSSYPYENLRFIHIVGARTEEENKPDCFSELMKKKQENT